MEEKIEQTATTEESKAEVKDTKKKKHSELDELKAKISELENKIKEADDKYLRMAAEYDNFRRRSREEREGVYESAVADTVGELLPIIDNLERAAMYDGEKVKEGLIMIEKSVKDVFGKLGVEAVGAVGDKFDPNLHNAVMHAEDENLGEGEITDVFQKGYKKGKRVIRFAMVKSVN